MNGEALGNLSFQVKTGEPGLAAGQASFSEEVAVLSLELLINFFLLLMFYNSGNLWVDWK